MEKTHVSEIPRPLYHQNAELDCMTVLQYAIDVIFQGQLTNEELSRIGLWFKSKCDEKVGKL